jgi:RNA polymerase sigma factor (sigma-70 family)
MSERPSKFSDGLSDYLQQLGRIPLLTPAEELHLGGIVQNWLGHPDPPSALERSGTRARERMVAANLRLVVAICRGYRDRISNLHLEFLDLLQAGNLGLIRAVEKYDPCRGYRFSTYACWWIRQAVRQHINENGSSIKVPRPLLSMAYKAQSLQASSDVVLSTQAMAETLGEDPRRLEMSLRVVAQGRLTSLDKPVGAPSDETCLLDLIRDEHILSPEEDYRWLHDQLQCLDAREKQLLRLRYGPDEHRTFSAVAELMGVTKSYAQSLERRILRKLRHRLTPVLDPTHSA